MGRTARAGALGRSVTFVEDEDRALLKAVVKGTGVQLQQRQVPAVAVAAWQDRVERMSDDVRSVIFEERDERHLRRAEMETQKVRGWGGGGGREGWGLSGGETRMLN